MGPEPRRALVSLNQVKCMVLTLRELILGDKDWGKQSLEENTRIVLEPGCIFLILRERNFLRNFNLRRIKGNTTPLTSIRVSRQLSKLKPSQFKQTFASQGTARSTCQSFLSKTFSI